MDTTRIQTVPATATEAVQRSRSVDRVVRGIATSDGAGVKLTRVLTQNLQRRLDPFLMLDAFGTDNKDDYIGGFPITRTAASRPSPTCWPAACVTATAPAMKACWKTAARNGWSQAPAWCTRNCRSRKTAAWKASSSG
jgi:hypothetical protein